MARFLMLGRRGTQRPRKRFLPAAVAATLAFLFHPAQSAAEAHGAQDARVLRVLKLKHHESNHPHRDTGGEFRMLADFARRQGMAIVWLDAHQPSELHNRLLKGEGDIVAADLPPSLDIDPHIATSVAMGEFRYYAIGRRGIAANTPAELAGYRVAVPLTSPLWPYFNQLQAQVPDISVVVLPVDTSRVAMLKGTSEGEYDIAVIAARPDENPIENLPRLETLFELSDLRPVTWYFRKERVELRDEINRYLKRFHASYLAPRRALGDLGEIKRRRVLRVITRIDPQNYFLRGGRPAGFEYELVRQFTAEHGLGVEFLVGETDRQILKWLRSGAGDVITTRINQRAVGVDPAIEQSLDYFHSASVIISRAGSGISRPEHLNGRRVAVLGNTVHHRTLGELVGAGTAIEPIIINPDTPLDSIIDQLENWVIDAAIVDAYAIDDIRDGHPLIQAGVSLPVQFNYAWTMRTRDVNLRAAVDRFLREQFRMETYNVLARRYFGRSRYAQFARPGHLSPYDDLVRRHAEPYGFDWRLIVAQMYQESQFDPDAQSEAGALGLMQLLPRTAHEMGVGDPFDPEAGILGGIRYLRYLWNRFDDQVPPRERTWFALAAYNIGFNRIERARQRASDQALDPNLWFGHVEQAMRMMSTDGSACKCGQTVVYVRAIRSLYNTYHRLRETLMAGLASVTGAPTI